MAGPRISLEQWKSLVSVVESGGYAKASEKIHKSQSTLSYSIQKLERLLGVKVFEIQGRKARLTDSGHILYARGKALVAEAEQLERAVVAAAPSHPLHQLGRPVVAADLKPHRHLVIRDTGSQRVRATSVVANQRWVVSHKATSIRAAVMGLGFAWFPEEAIREELASGQLKVLPMREGTERYATLYLIYADRDALGPGARRLAAVIRDRVEKGCPDAVKAGAPAAMAQSAP